MQIVLAEDNSADVLLVRLALEGAGLNCEIRVMNDGEQVLASVEDLDTNPQAAPRDHDQAKKHAAMHYFRKPSNLSEYIELGGMVRDLLVGPTVAASHAGILGTGRAGQ